MTKDTTDNTVVGTSVPYIDAWEKVTGKARFGADVKLPGMLEGKILRSPHAHARIVHIDTSAALRLPGVRAVITGQDTPQVRYGTMIADQFVLAIDKVRFVGEEVAAVAAVDLETAEEALELIRVEYEPLPAVFDVEAALLPDAPQLHAQAPGNVADHIAFERGDVEAAYRSADVVLTQRFTTSVVHQCYLEPNSCVAAFDGADYLTVWAPTQGPFAARPVLARALGMTDEQIRFVQTYTGGGFGGKTWQQVWAVCAALARAAGKPVRIVLTREEEFEATLPRVPSVIDLTMGVSSDGLLMLKDARILSGNGAYSISAPAVNYVTATRYDSLYRLHNIRVQADLVYTNTIPTGMFRGFGNPQMHFAAESLLDMLAERIGMDPVEIRLRNAARPGDTSAHGWYLGSCALSETIREAAAAAGWQEKRSTGRRPLRGIGLASCIHVAGNRSIYKPYDGSSARARVDASGAVEIVSGESDIGQGSRTVFAQIAADALGVPLNSIQVTLSDTDSQMYAIGTVASRVTTLGGQAVRLAAADARRQIIDAVAESWGVDAGELEIAGGEVRSRASDRRCNFPAAAEIAVDRLGGQPVVGVGEYRVDGVVMPDPKTKYGNIASAYSFGTQVAEVEIDPETGKVRVLNFVAAHDVGRAINPMAVEGQIEGAIAQGIGYALLEETKIDQGRVVNPDFLDYRVPTALDVSPVQSILVDSYEPKGPFGAKSIGETALVPTVAAIANALYDAAGIRLTDLPMTPDKILKALQAKREKEEKEQEEKEKGASA